MTHAVINPPALHDPTPFGYSHTACTRAGASLVFVAGQYGSDADGAVVSTVFSEQVERAFANLGVALAAHELDFSHVVQLRTYVVNLGFDELGAIARVVQTHWSARLPAQTLLGVSALAMPDIRFEVEAVAVRA